MTTTDRAPRETRIDIVRGVAMLIIAINHITVAFQIYGLNGFGIPTPTALGYSSSAAIFVIMSGYMVGMVYQKKPRPAHAVLLRARTLYINNVLLLIAVAPLLLLMKPWEAVAWDAGFLFNNPLLGLAMFVTLLRAPVLLDVLQLYVIFMLLAPAALWLHRRSPAGLAVVSVTLWLLSQLATATHLLDPKLVEWKFNPAAWQILFFIPMILGSVRVHTPLFDLLEKRKWMTLVIGCAMASFAVAKLLHVEQVMPSYWLLTSKGNLGVLRLIHAPVVILFYCGLLALSRQIPELAPMRAIACIGRQTLYCYIVSVWLTYALAIAWSRLSGGYLSYLAAVLVSLLVTFFIAVLFDARSGRRAARMREAPPRDDERRMPAHLNGAKYGGRR